MENTKRQVRPPVLLLLLNLLGLSLIGLGMAELFAGTGFVPEAYRVENYAIIMIALGFALDIPLIAWTMKRNIRNANRP